MFAQDSLFLMFDTISEDLETKLQKMKYKCVKKILQSIYSQAAAKVYLDHVVSDKFRINTGVIQADPISPKLFTAAIDYIFKKAGITGGINVD